MRIAVILPAGYGGGTLRGAVNLAIQLHDGSRAAGSPAFIEFGYVDVGQADVYEGFRELRKRNIPTRPIKIDLCKGSDLAFVSKTIEPDERYAIFNDGISNFDDSDFLIIVSDHVYEGLVAPTYEYGMVVYDFIQRYVPDVFNAYDEENSRSVWLKATSIARHYVHARVLFTTTEFTTRDAVAYGGVAPEKIVKLPISFDPISFHADNVQASPSQYFIWATNTTVHKNHVNTLRAIDKFISQRKNLKVIVTGPYTENLDPNRPVDEIMRHAKHVKLARDVVHSSPNLLSNVEFRGHMSDWRYLALLANADFLLHTAIIDNGTFSVLEAAWFGVPSVSTDYAPMREIADKFSLDLTYCDAGSVDSIASAMSQVYMNRDRLAAGLPSRDALARYSTTSCADDVWRLVSNALLKAQA